MKSSGYVLLSAVVLSVGSLSLNTTVSHQSHNPVPAALHATDAAYRDGVFLGHYDRLRGTSRHLSVGRWSNAADRSLFAQGYEKGYGGTEQ